MVKVHGIFSVFTLFLRRPSYELGPGTVTHLSSVLGGTPSELWVTRDLLMSPSSAGKGCAHRTPLIWVKVSVLRWVREIAHKKGPRGRFGLFFGPNPI